MKLGFDCNCKLSLEKAKKFKLDGYQFAIRYVGRTRMASFDLDNKELNNILNSGLKLGVVQHCLNPGWTPSKQLGITYGVNAASFARQCGYEKGCIIYLDLEGLKKVSKDIIIEFCNEWYDSVNELGYTPGIYIGFNIWLSSEDLYYKLKFKNYWAAFNTPATPIIRGFQMRQKLQKKVNGINIDPNELTGDKLGGMPKFMSKEIKLPNKEELKKACLNNPELWNNAIQAAKEKSNLGDVEVIKYFDDALFKAFKYGLNYNNK